MVDRGKKVLGLTFHQPFQVILVTDSFSILCTTVITITTISTIITIITISITITIIIGHTFQRSRR